MHELEIVHMILSCDHRGA